MISVFPHPLALERIEFGILRACVRPTGGRAFGFARFEGFSALSRVGRGAGLRDVDVRAAGAK